MLIKFIKDINHLYKSWKVAKRLIDLGFDVNDELGVKAVVYLVKKYPYLPTEEIVELYKSMFNVTLEFAAIK